MLAQGLWLLAGVLEPGYPPGQGAAICRKRVRLGDFESSFTGQIQRKSIEGL